MLLEDGQSVAAFYELVPLGTEGREPGWLAHARDALENALQDSFDELDENPWVLQLYAQDEPSFDQYMQTLRDYVQPRARGSAFTEFYLRFFGHHPRAVAKPGGLFEDTVVTRLMLARPDAARAHGGVPPRERQGQQTAAARHPSRCWASSATACAAAWRTPASRRMVAADVHDWLLRWFNPRPTLLGPGVEDRERFTRWRAIRQYRGKRGRRDRAGERAGFQPAAVLWAAALGRGARPGTSTACRTAC